MTGSEIPTGQVAGFELRSTMINRGQPVDAEQFRAASVLIVEADAGSRDSLDAIRTLLADARGCPVIAAVVDPSLNDVRTLMHLGVADVLPLPLTLNDLETSLQRIRFDLESRRGDAAPSGKVITAIKCRGGAGATMVLTQLGAMMAPERPDQVCLADFDIQFGNAALYLGELPSIGISDLLDAGQRADSELLKTTITRHSTGLDYLAAPRQVMPLDAVESDQVLSVLDLLASRYDTVLVDLPQNWTNWSLSAVARADTILLISEMSVAGFHRARRQLDFLAEQGLGDRPVQLVMNKVRKKMFKTLGFDDAERSIGKPVAYSIADDEITVESALNQGLPIVELEPRSKIAKDLKAMADALAAAEMEVAGS